MTATSSEAGSSEQTNATPATAPIPKRITNAQTVCNEKNAKGKLCNGHLSNYEPPVKPRRFTCAVMMCFSSVKPAARFTWAASRTRPRSTEAKPVC